jgi:acetylornithine deacetylase/succinyl-diaminopimelate desuccinylase-like protein
MTLRRLASSFTLALAALAASMPMDAQSGPPTADRALVREIYKELIETNTTHSTGSTTDAANKMAARFRAAGFPAADVVVTEPFPAKGNLVVRYRGSGARPPILLLAHLDVVEARREDWSLDPFVLTERDGYYYGRGTSDDKAMAAIWVANLLRYRREGFVPDRDIIVALTADEEGGDHNGVDWLVQNRRALIDAAFALNEGGGGQLLAGQRILNEVQTTEKVFQSFTFETHNPGGHSSLPRPDNAIYELMHGLARVEAYDFPVHLNETTRAFFQRMASIEGANAADLEAVAATPPDAGAAARLSAASPYYNAMLRTTCVATMLAAGHAENALPQSATATVNCRMVPGENAADLQRTLVRVLADTGITVTPIGIARPSNPSPLTPEVMGAVERATESMWPGVPVVPTMVSGATDGLYLRNAGIPTYGVSGLFEDVNDTRAHGKDERMGVQAFHEGQEFLYRLVKLLATKPSP